MQLLAAATVALLLAAPTGASRATPDWRKQLSHFLGAQPEEPLVATDAIASFAKRVSQSQSSPADKASALYQALLSLKREGKMVGDPDNTPKKRIPKTAATLFAQTIKPPKKPDADALRAGCYEFSALYIAAARSVGLDAVGLEVAAHTGTGQIGHILAGVRVDKDAPLLLFDLQNESQQSIRPVRVLSDQEMVAHHYNHHGVSHYLRGEVHQALEDFGAAVWLAPAGASFRNNRATAWLALREPILAEADAVVAVQRSPQTPLYQYQLGLARLQGGRAQQAIPHLESALILEPSFTLAQTALNKAQELARSSP